MHGAEMDALDIRIVDTLQKRPGNIGQARARLATLLHRGAQGVDVIQRRREFVPMPETEAETE